MGSQKLVFRRLLSFRPFRKFYDCHSDIMVQFSISICGIFYWHSGKFLT